MKQIQARGIKNIFLGGHSLGALMTQAYAAFELPDGRPGLSSGVERELQHAHEATREVFVIWRSRVQPSPFITETATEVFDSTDGALDYFRRKGYIKNH